MEAARDLRLVQCADCERLQVALDAALMDLEAARAEAGSLRRQLGAAQGKQGKARKQHPHYDMAVRLFEFWQEQCGHERAQMGPKRERALLSRLDDYSARDIAKAIRGAAVAAYVDPRGVKHDDIELICRDEVKLEKFIERYERWRESQHGG
jgi:hypothetical protein